MTSRERIETALAHKQPDRTPVFEYVLLSPRADEILKRPYSLNPAVWPEIEKEKGHVAKLTAEYDARLKDIDNERRAKIVEAVEEGKKLAAEVKANAQAEVREMHDKAKADLEREVAKAKVQLRDDMIGMTMSAAEKFIGEKLDNEEHRRLIGNFIDGLEKA